MKLDGWMKQERSGKKTYSLLTEGEGSSSKMEEMGRTVLESRPPCLQLCPGCWNQRPYSQSYMEAVSWREERGTRSETHVAAGQNSGTEKASGVKPSETLVKTGRAKFENIWSAVSGSHDTLSTTADLMLEHPSNTAMSFQYECFTGIFFDLFSIDFCNEEAVL